VLHRGTPACPWPIPGAGERRGSRRAMWPISNNNGDNCGMKAANSAARLIVVCGLPGSGKTTHASQLEAKLRAVRFCPDEWMDTLEIDLWDETARERIESLQWAVAQNLLTLGLSVIIEWGTWSRQERDRLRLRARSLGAAVELHFLDVPMDVIFTRIRQRNREKPPIQALDLAQWGNLLQRPSPEEMALFDVVNLVQQAPLTPSGPR
jgi:predicted kinase